LGQAKNARLLRAIGLFSLGHLASALAERVARVSLQVGRRVGHLDDPSEIGFGGRDVAGLPLDDATVEDDPREVRLGGLAVPQADVLFGATPPFCPR
jgi:hypothetical protein